MSEKVITINRKAYHEYFIDEKLEAGIVLTGTEVKSLRRGKASLTESYAIVRSGECWLVSAHISPYEEGNIYNHEPLRTRKLLLHRDEIKRLHAKVAEKGFTLVPIRMYFKRGKAKVELGIARGKKLYDKREALVKKEARREMDRAVKNPRQTSRRGGSPSLR
ncbi:MAG: SsrA-binding protein SmpB [Candidatus Eremiobacteraeota bacterium]|nr:SsrA-binding protein SmpB [Candidatus Eremiobacteraeota bacterium]